MIFGESKTGTALKLKCIFGESETGMALKVKSPHNLDSNSHTFNGTKQLMFA